MIAIDLSGRRALVTGANSGLGPATALNLAAAVQVMAYELGVARQYAGLDSVRPEVMPASHEQVEGFFRHLEETLTQIGFFNTKHPTKLMQKLRRLYARARMEQEEINILRGILTATQEAQFGPGGAGRKAAARKDEGEKGS